MRRFSFTSLLLLQLTVFIFSPSAKAEVPYVIEWSSQIALSNFDALAVDGAGNIYASGKASESLIGGSAYDRDAFITKYDSSGNVLWMEFLGSTKESEAISIAIGPGGNVYITGRTSDGVDNVNGNFADIYFAKYDPSGNQLLKKQYGSDTNDSPESVAVDNQGNIFISGYTYGNLGESNAGQADMFLTKFDPAGNILWAEQLGTNQIDIYRSVGVDDAGNAYVCGSTRGSLGGVHLGYGDIYLAKYDPSGNQLWSEQLGTSTDEHFYSVAVNGDGYAYFAGRTVGDLGAVSAGPDDAVIAKYDPDGNQLWLEQLGSSERDRTYNIAIDDSGNAYITGQTWGDLGGSNAGEADIFLAKYDGSGNLLLVQQFGSEEDDDSSAIAVDESGGVYISGETYAGIAGINQGQSGMFIVKLTQLANSPLASSGDINGDGVIGLADLDILGRHFGQTGVTLAQGDLNGSGSVTLLDLDILGEHWGESVAVPEPGVLGIMIAGGMLVVRRG